ncbi:MAG: fused MFS/spermidine synthase [Deltaproteobacteria bacterium]|nr:fused MFS/spermidine synthase [Deltaproteobacteria bacterium]MBW2384133.1 fused MFS/spermidine synthase [Deltaproteobacteria bacterium]
MIRALALFLTVLTGFSGLVYEIAWQRYLGTLLGSHTEATAAVLAIFLGGLSLGYWLFGAVTRRVVVSAEAAGRPPRLLLLYGLLEGGIGVYVLAFPWLFKGVQLLSYAIPHGPAGLGFAIDVGLSALLIGPASVLMGGTIPILTQALARSLDDATRFHAFVYAFNTAGAFVGALAAGFYLVPRLGLVNVMLAMGTINLFAGTVFVLLGRRGREVISLEQEPVPGGGERSIEGFGSYAAVAALSGFAMMALQTIVIRMAGLSFGSSQFTFSIVVAVFVLCIALGSFLVSTLSRIPTLLVVLNQWALALFVVLLYFQLDTAPYWVHALRTLFTAQTAAFGAYYFLGFLLVLAAIGPAVILSGAALPLLFHHMRRQVGHLGDLAGNLYSWNTVGSLLGALLCGHLLLFWLDLHHVYRLAVAALVLAALALTMRVYGIRLIAGAAVIPLLLAVVLLPDWDPQIQYSGLFRVREALEGSYAGPRAFVARNAGRFSPNILFHTDDPIASVTVTEFEIPGHGRALNIATNGKSDGHTYVDYTTMAMAATLPALMAQQAESAFVIGWGTGITAGELASLGSMQRVDVAEISPGVLQAAPLFDFANLDASTNPKINVIRSDAYRALMRVSQQYDVIVSEPSSLWVTGEEILYSREFLAAARDRLSPGGVYCQWIHQYETDRASIEMVLRTYAAVFDQIAVWSTTYNDLLLLGWGEGASAIDHFTLAERAKQPDFQASLRRAGVTSFPALLAHEVLPLGVVHALELEGPLHTLYRPRLSDVAGRAFFRGDRGSLPFAGFGEPARIGRENSLYGSWARLQGEHLPEQDRAAFVMESCRSLGPRCQAPLAQWLSEETESEIFERVAGWVEATLSAVAAGLGMTVADPAHLEDLAGLFEGARRISGSGAFKTPDGARQASRDFEDLYLHATPFHAERLLDVWSTCREGQRSLQQCTEWANAQALVESGQTATELLGQCLSVRDIGPACKQGEQLARSLLRKDD